MASAIVALLLAGGAIAQNGVISIYKVGGLKSGTTVDAGANVRFLIRHFNDTGEKCDVSNGYKLSSPDGAIWDSTTIDSIGPINNAGTPDDPSDDFSVFFVNRFDIAFAMSELSCDGQGGDTVGVLGAGNPNSASKQLTAGWNDSTYAITAWFNGKKQSAGKHICIDSSFYGVGGTWKWVTKTLLDKEPAWVGLPGQPYSDGVGPERLGSGYCFDIYAPGLGVSVDSLGFSAQLGGPVPAAQSFTVSSSGDTFGDNLSFTLTELSSWLVKSPTSGTTPRAISVSVNTTGLTPGQYIDSIKVESATAYNSPLWVKVTLEVIAPPPTIFVNKSNFIFNALTGGADPAPQTFYVKNIGGGTLSWSITNSSAWLTANPPAGTDSATITVSASIAALGPGDHFDTLVLVAAGATNTPVKIPVKLSLGSSLPMIATDSAVYHVIVDAPNTLLSRTIHVSNAGIGALTFTVSENSDRIFSFTPGSGTAPQSVSITFKILTGSDGAQYFDTLWLSSPEAVNSPYPVIFHSRVMDVPPILAISTDTLEFVTYDCEGFPGTHSIPPVPRDSFLAYDTSGSLSMVTFKAMILNGSDYCTMSPDQEDLPAFFVGAAGMPSLAPGVYYDTILVGVLFAYNSPETVIVKYTRYGQGTDPELILSREDFGIPRQEQTGPVQINFTIQNGDYGCLPWYINEEIPWFDPLADSGNVPAQFTGLLQVDNFTLGTYSDSFFVVAPTAANSPKMVRVKLRVWKLHGDFNWDGFLNLVDLSSMISYLLTGAPLPQPEYAVGDTNCSGLIDLVDLTRLIAYLVGHPTVPICGNP